MRTDKKEKILKMANERVTSTEVARRLRISRQAAARHLAALVESGLLFKSGSTRSSCYSTAKIKSAPSTESLLLTKNIRGLEEDIVFNEISLRLNLKRRVSKKTYQILSYAFTEMLNNAIDHSKSAKVQIQLDLNQRSIAFEVVDKGIGIFKKIQTSFRLKTPFEAIEHLFKGKQTTDPARHSGQGIFFTSRIADTFSIRSERLKVTLDNKLNDTFIREDRKVKGTAVAFSISKQSRKNLADVFKKFSSDQIEFDKNSVRISLSSQESLLSRSQAKRLLIGLDDFEYLDFSFKGIKEIGQAFADEIFRVYARNHPNKILSYSNAAPPIAHMIERAKKPV